MDSKKKKKIELEIFSNNESEKVTCPICGDECTSEVPKWLRVKGAKDNKGAVCLKCAEKHNLDLYIKVGISDILFELQKMAAGLEADDYLTFKGDLYSLSQSLGNNMRWIDHVIEKKALRSAQKLADTGIVFQNVTIDGIDISVNKEGVAAKDNEIPF